MSRSFVATLALAAALTSCSAWDDGDRVAPQRPIVLDPLLPGIDARGKDDPLADEFEHLERSGRHAFANLAARRWYPEAVAASVSAATPLRRGAVAAALDALDTTAAPRGAFLEPTPDTDPWPAQRDAVLDALGRGDLDAARELVPFDVDGAPPRTVIEARALAGFVLARAGETAAAHDEFVAAARVAEDSGWTWHASRAWLLACGAGEHGVDGAPADAESPWTRAVRHASACVESGGGLEDPVFWERAVGARGANAWSDAVVRALCAAYDVPIDDDARAEESADELVLLCAATSRLRRAEAVPALLTSRAVEQRSRTPRGRAWASLVQARALIALQRMTEARNVLTRGLEQDDAVVRSEALARLGALELAEERPERAAALLSRAIELAGRPIEFPARGEALANLGLALLSTSRDDEGLARLREGAQRFVTERDVEGLHLALANELEFARSLGRSQDVERLAALLRAVESGSGPR